ncbi:HNH endonuclease [Mycobacterium phage Buttons]|nr:HNH endonuclease [Mycobacterium phage Buttons]
MQWRPVVGHEGKYLVSDEGQILSLITGKTLRPATRESGHQHVMLAQPSRCALVHALVAESFLGPRPEGSRVEIRHLNGDATDNRVENLRYGTRSENAEDSKRHGTHFNAGRTHCKRGHELAGDNLQKHSGPGSRRTCLACRRERQALYRSGKQLTEEGYCINGHPKTPENRYSNGPRGSRCKPCARGRKAAS